MQNFNKNTSPQGAKGIGEKHKFINKDIEISSYFNLNTFISL